MTFKRGVVLFGLLWLPALTAWSQVLPDPTRPPAGIVEGAGDGGSAGDGNQVSMAPAMQGLTSIIISPERCAAVIDGKTVKLGEMHAGARLVEITPRAVVLESGKGRRTQELFHGVGVKLTAAEAPARPAAVCKLNAGAADKKSDKRVPGQSRQKEKK